jgi:hypothetical protein
MTNRQIEIPEGRITLSRHVPRIPDGERDYPISDAKSLILNP